MIDKQGNRYVINGPVTLDNVADLIVEGAAFDSGQIIVDLAGVARADSSLLSLMLEWTRQARRSGRQIAFTNLGHDARSLADVYGVIDLIPVAAG